MRGFFGQRTIECGCGGFVARHLRDMLPKQILAVGLGLAGECRSEVLGGLGAGNIRNLIFGKCDAAFGVAHRAFLRNFADLEIPAEFATIDFHVDPLY